MGELQRSVGNAAIKNLRTIVRHHVHRFGRNFGIACKAVWKGNGRKPAAELAAEADCTERTAENYIAGRREPSLNAWFALMNELRK